MENEIIFDDNPVIDSSIDSPTLAPTDDIIPAGIDPDCVRCGELTPEIPGCPESLPDGGITLGAFFGTLQECVTITWRYHLKTRKHHIHITLNEFYDKALDVVDDIIEQYQGINGVIEEPFINKIYPEEKSEVEYLIELKTFVETNKTILGEHSEINSTIDEFLALIDSTVYKITSFCESAVKSFSDFCYEDIDEHCSYDRYGERTCDDPDDDDYDPEYGEEE